MNTIFSFTRSQCILEAKLKAIKSRHIMFPVVIVTNTLISSVYTAILTHTHKTYTYQSTHYNINPILVSSSCISNSQEGDIAQLCRNDVIKSGGTAHLNLTPTLE